jgi:hypothetical protein
MSEYPIVEISWKDHYSLPDEWYAVSEESSIRIIKSSGYLFKEDVDHYYICTNIDNETETISSGIAILKICVLEKIVLKEKNSNDNFVSRKRKSNKKNKL